jgi:release factor glutamine methyltransferase
VTRKDILHSFEQARRSLSLKLDTAQMPDSELEARLLLMHASGLSRAQLISESRAPIPADAAARLDALAARRLAGEPVDHILGWRMFYGRRFRISKDVLSPRQETEEVVAKALRLIADIPAPQILDIGTGSGAMIITAACERPKARGVAVDISAAALKIACVNAAAHGAAERIEFLRGSWLAPVRGTFDLIMSNPPYIERAALASLSKEVKDYDPMPALDGGEDGLDPYREIAMAAPPHMSPQGRIVLEIGCNQGQSAMDIFKTAGFRDLQLEHDLAGLPRIISGRRPK